MKNAIITLAMIGSSFATDTQVHEHYQNLQPHMTQVEQAVQPKQVRSHEAINADFEKTKILIALSVKKYKEGSITAQKHAEQMRILTNRANTITAEATAKMLKPANTIVQNPAQVNEPTFVEKISSFLSPVTNFFSKVYSYIMPQ